MKRIVLALGISLLASTAMAGGYSEPVVEPEVVVQETAEAAGSDDWVVAMMTFMVMVALVGGQ